MSYSSDILMDSSDAEYSNVGLEEGKRHDLPTAAANPAAKPKIKYRRKGRRIRSSYETYSEKIGRLKVRIDMEIY